MESTPLWLLGAIHSDLDVACSLEGTVFTVRWLQVLLSVTHGSDRAAAMRVAFKRLSVVRVNDLRYCVQFRPTTDVVHQKYYSAPQGSNKTTKSADSVSIK